MPCIQSYIHCSTTCIFIAVQLLNNLGYPHWGAHITTHSLQDQVILNMIEHHETTLKVQYINHFTTVNKLEILLVLKMACDQDPELQSVRPSKLVIDCATSWVTSIRILVGTRETCRLGIIWQLYTGWYNKSTNIWWPLIGGTTLAINSMFEIHVNPDGQPLERGDNCATEQIVILRATTFNNLVAYTKSIGTFTWMMWKSGGLLGVTMVVTSLVDLGEIETINSGAGCERRKQEWQLLQERFLLFWNDHYWMARSQWEVVGPVWFDLFLGELCDHQVPGLISSSSSQMLDRS